MNEEMNECCIVYIIIPSLQIKILSHQRKNVHLRSSPIAPHVMERRVTKQRFLCLLLNL